MFQFFFRMVGCSFGLLVVFLSSHINFPPSLSLSHSIPSPSLAYFAASSSFFSAISHKNFNFLNLSYASSFHILCNRTPNKYPVASK